MNMSLCQNHKQSLSIYLLWYPPLLHQPHNHHTTKSPRIYHPPNRSQSIHPITKQIPPLPSQLHINQIYTPPAHLQIYPQKSRQKIKRPKYHTQTNRHSPRQPPHQTTPIHQRPKTVTTKPKPLIPRRSIQPNQKHRPKRTNQPPRHLLQAQANSTAITTYHRSCAYHKGS